MVSEGGSRFPHNPPVVRALRPVLSIRSKYLFHRTLIPERKETQEVNSTVSRPWYGGTMVLTLVLSTSCRASVCRPSLKSSVVEQLKVTAGTSPVVQ